MFQRINQEQPPIIALSICEKCNLNCWYCYSEHKEQKEKYLSLDDVKNIVQKLPKCTLCIWGGEPTCHPDLPSILEYLYTCNLYSVILYTNGMKNITDIPIGDNLRIYFTYHPFIKNELRLLQNIIYFSSKVPCRVTLMLDGKNTNKCIDFYHKIKDLNVLIEPRYLYLNQELQYYDVPELNFKLYEDNKGYTIKEALEYVNAHKRKCFINRYVIYADGKIESACKNFTDFKTHCVECSDDCQELEELGMPKMIGMPKTI